MSLIAYVLQNIVGVCAQVLEILIIVRVLLSWVNHNHFNPLIIQLYRITDIFLKPFQNIIPPEKIGIDISPIFALMAISLVARFLVNLLVF